MIKARIRNISEFTEEEIQLIREGIEKIQAWVEEHNVPKFEIVIPNDVYELEFFVDSKKCHLRVGCNRYDFVRSEHDVHNDIERYWLCSNLKIPYAFEVIRNWLEIKEEILKVLEFENETKKILYNFEV